MSWFDTFWPMTDEMERLHGAGWGGYNKDEGTTSYIGQAEADDEPCYVVVGCLDGQWSAEACDPDTKELIAAGYGSTPQEALDDLL